MQNMNTEDIVTALIVIIAVLVVTLICALIVCSYYHERYKNLRLENYRLRRTVKGQADLRFASNAAYQEMLNAAFGTQRIN